MGTIQDGGSDLFTAYGLESVSSNLDISNEVLYIVDEMSLNPPICMYRRSGYFRR